ncbi:MAG: hypothetical protein Q4G39_08645, partial [Brachymonas sp.]|nr:hypothetical protein [Brachymonas sp.]
RPFWGLRLGGRIFYAQRILRGDRKQALTDCAGPVLYKQYMHGRSFWVKNKTQPIDINLFFWFLHRTNPSKSLDFCEKVCKCPFARG